MKISNISVLSLSIGLFIASCHTCVTKDTTTSDSSTTMAGNAACVPAVAPAPANSPGSPDSMVMDKSNTASTGSGAIHHNGSRRRGKADSIDYSNYTLKTKNNTTTSAAPVNNPPQGTFGNSVPK